MTKIPVSKQEKEEELRELKRIRLDQDLIYMMKRACKECKEGDSIIQPDWWCHECQTDNTLRITVKIIKKPYSWPACSVQFVLHCVSCGYQFSCYSYYALYENGIEKIGELQSYDYDLYKELRPK